MADPRWTEEAEALVYKAVSLGPENLELARDRRDLTADILAALADASLLLPPGTETDTLWAIRSYDAEGELIAYAASKERAFEKLEKYYDASDDASVVSRRVHTGPWREVAS